MRLGERINKLRTQKNFSQGDLADALEVSRQSISKWETNASVPELDKLVKLSEIFGVSLDELILDKKPPEEPAEPEPKVIYVERTNSMSTKKVVGIVLLCFAALVWLMITLFGDIVAGLVLASPFIACGLICLFVRKNVGLWCIWVVYFFIELYLRFATGISWKFVLLPQMYTGGRAIHLIIAWALWSSFAALTIVTALRFRQTPPESLRNNAIATAISWVVYILTWFAFVLPRHEPITDRNQILLYRFATSVSGWVRNILLVVALAFTVRLIVSLWKKRKCK